MGFSKVFSLGNKADLNENDLLAMFANDYSTKVILMYIEDLVDGRKFIEIASRLTGELEKRRPILALKVGESTIGSKSIASAGGTHTVTLNVTDLGSHGDSGGSTLQLTATVNLRPRPPKEIKKAAARLADSLDSSGAGLAKGGKWVGLRPEFF